MKISVLPGDDAAGTCRTFVLEGVSILLGKALKVTVDQYEEVEFCRQRSPYIGKPILHFRIQARGTTAIEILKRGLADVDRICTNLADEEIKKNGDTQDI